MQVRKSALETLFMLSSGATGQHWLPYCILEALRSNKTWTFFLGGDGGGLCIFLITL